MGTSILHGLRHREFGRLDQSGTVYLDYTGSALYPASLVDRHARLLMDAVPGNPHARHAPSARATAWTEAARDAVLAFFDADPAEYAVVFTANASDAFRLVGEAFPFTEGSSLRLSADNHNSINGLRTWAEGRGTTVETVPLDAHLRPSPPGMFPVASAPSLFAFPAQSNFSGVRHPLALVADARRAGWHVLLDAAAYVPTSSLSLRTVSPDFVGLSFYKMFGYPTGVGALLARHEALAALRRPWYAGGTVDFVSLAHKRYQRTPGPAGFEDGTPNFLALAAVPNGLDFLHTVTMEAVAAHTSAMTATLLDRLQSLSHANGKQLILVHGPADTIDRGGTVAFSVLDADGTPVSYETVEMDASAAGIALRGGCFCNPGCAEVAFGLDDIGVPACLDRLGPGEFTPARLRTCLDDRPVGALRASVGIPTVPADLDTLHSFLHTHYRNRSLAG